MMVLLVSVTVLLVIISAAQILKIAEFFAENETVKEDGKEKLDYVNLPKYGYNKNNSNGYANALIELAGGKLDKLPINATGKGDTETYKKTYEKARERVDQIYKDINVN